MRDSFGRAEDRVPTDGDVFLFVGDGSRLEFVFGAVVARGSESSRCSRLTNPQFALPHKLAIMPPGMPPVLSARPKPMPFSPHAKTAALLRLVGAGGLANVEGARVVVRPSD